METEKAKYLYSRFYDSIDDTARSKVKNEIETLPDSAFEPLSNVQLKSKTVTLVLSILLGGVCAARFYLGDVKFGVLKIIATVALTVLSVVIDLFLPIRIFSIIISIVIFIWWALEIYLCSKRVKTVNTERVEEVIRAYKGKQ